MVYFPGKHGIIYAGVFLMVTLATLSALQAQDKLLISYGGHNETVGPMWVAVTRGYSRDTASTSICSRCATARSA
jgi:hypothetical protein